MRISELKFEECIKPGDTNFSMHTQPTDAMLVVPNQEVLDEVKTKILASYGDVEVKVDFDAPWFNRIQILDPKWIEDRDKYEEQKAEWHSQFGSN